MRWKFLGKMTAGLVVSGLLLSGCSGGGGSSAAGDGTPVDGGTLTWAVSTQPGAGGLDPMVVMNQASIAVLQRIYDTLLVKDDDGNIKPNLASGYKQVNKTTYDVALRDDVKFSNGDALTPDDVIYTMEQYQKAAGSAKQFLQGLKKMSAPDEHTVRFEFEKPNGMFVNGLASRSTFMIVNKKWYSSTSKEDRQKSTMGTGPFKFDSWNNNVDLTLVRNDGYWGERPHLDKIVQTFVPDENTRLSLAQQKQADMVWFDDADVAEQSKASGFEVGTAYNTARMSVFVNPESGPLKDIKVRQALSLSLDRDKLMSVGLNGHGEKTLETVAGDPSAPKPDDKTPNYTRDIEKAKQLLSEAGQTNPTIQLSYPADISKKNIPVYELMQEQAKEAGINLKLVATPWTEISKTFTYGDSFKDLVAFGNIYSPDWTGYFNQTLNDTGLLNHWKKNSDADKARAMLKDLQVETDLDKRADIAKQMNNEVADKVLKLSVGAQPQAIIAWNPDKVKGFSTDPYSFFYHLNDMWIQE